MAKLQLRVVLTLGVKTPIYLILIPYCVVSNLFKDYDHVIKHHFQKYLNNFMVFVLFVEETRENHRIDSSKVYHFEYTSLPDRNRTHRFIGDTHYLQI